MANAFEYVGPDDLLVDCSADNLTALWGSWNARNRIRTTTYPRQSDDVKRLSKFPDFKPDVFIHGLRESREMNESGHGGGLEA